MLENGGLALGFGYQLLAARNLGPRLGRMKVDEALLAEQFSFFVRCRKPKRSQSEEIGALRMPLRGAIPTEQ